MKKLSIIIIILIAVTTSAAYAAKFKPGSEPTGFRKIKWGTPTSKIKNFDKMTKSKIGNIDLYTLVNSDGTTREIQIGTTKYHYGLIIYENKLVGVMISTENKMAFEYLKKICIRKYGHDFKKEFDGIAWFGEKSNVVISQMAENFYVMSITMTKFDKLLDKIIAEKDKNAVNDF